jgi:hypothetical protein
MYSEDHGYCKVFMPSFIVFFLFIFVVIFNVVSLWLK